MASEVSPELAAKLQMIEVKRGQLIDLYNDIRANEAQVPARYRKPLLTNADGTDSSELELERLRLDVKRADEKIELLNAKLATNEELLELREKAVSKAHEELMDMRQRNDELSDRIKDVEAHNLRLQDERVIASTAGGGSGERASDQFRHLIGTADESYFHLIDKLENEIKVKNAELLELWDDRKALTKQLTIKDQAIDSLRTELTSRTQAFEDVATLEGHVREQQQKIKDMAEDIGLLNNMCRVKDHNIEKLHRELEERTQSEEYVRQLEAAVRNKEAVIEGLQEDVADALSLVDKRDKELDKVASAAAVQGSGMSFREWYEERKGYKAEQERLLRAKAEQDRTIRSQHERINKLTARLDSLSRSLNDTAHLSPRHASMLATPRRPGGGVFIDEDGQEMVSAQLFDALSRDVHIMKIKLEEKDNCLLEKDDVIECHERNNDILERSAAQEKKSAQQAMAKLESRIKQLEMMLSQKDKDFKEREQQLKMENIRLKKSMNSRNRPSSAASTPRGSVLEY